MNVIQYPIVCESRRHYDALLWQTPTLAITAQAFLLSAAFGKDVRQPITFLLFSLSLIVGLATLHLMYKHWAFELRASELIRKFEKERADDDYSETQGPIVSEGPSPNWLANLSAYWVWVWVLSLFCMVAAAYCIGSFQEILGACIPCARGS